MTMQLSSTPHASGTTGAASVSGAAGAGPTEAAVLRCLPGSPSGSPSGARRPRWARLFPRAAAALLTLAAGCGEPAAPDTSPPSSAASYFVELPAELGHGDQAMGSLRTALHRHGLEIKNEYSELVGLAGTVSVHGSATDIQALLQELPGLQARAVTWRYPDGSCGDASCDSDEAATADRGPLSMGGHRLDVYRIGGRRMADEVRRVLTLAPPEHEIAASTSFSTCEGSSKL